MQRVVSRTKHRCLVGVAVPAEELVAVESAQKIAGQSASTKIQV